jgi:hypothetical protein
MSEPQALTPAEHDILVAALSAPLFNRDPGVMGLCLRLCGHQLLQRAGGMAVANGWRGSPHAFVLTRQGWALLKTERRHTPIRRAG